MENLSQSRPGVRFAVDDVVPADRMLWSEPLGESLSHRLSRKIVALSNSTQPIVNPGMDGLKPEMRQKIGNDFANRMHGLVDAVHTAFSLHYPLILSPDAIWLVIAQGFSHHIAQEAEELRARLVRHQGRTKLEEKTTDLSLQSFERMIAGFSGQIREASDAVLYETIVCNFTTTTPDIRIASEVVLMDTYSSYFEYAIRCVCGIPRVTVTGTPEDWQNIRQRVEIFETYGLTWWVERLRPILDKFICSAKGSPDPTFWQAIYKPRKTYGATSVTGWIADLFPYLNDAPTRRRNHVFDYKRSRWELPLNAGIKTEPVLFDRDAAKGVSTKSFPCGLSSVPVEVSIDGGSTYKLDLVDGFFGVSQSEDHSLSPVIHWAVAEPPPAKPIVI